MNFLDLARAIFALAFTLGIIGLAEGGNGVRMVRTSAMHIAPAGPTARFESRSAPDSETTLDGNSVVVEEQMLKMAESRMAYDAAIGFYQKSMQMLRLAARPPGR